MLSAQVVIIIIIILFGIIKIMLLCCNSNHDKNYYFIEYVRARQPVVSIKDVTFLKQFVFTDV